MRFCPLDVDGIIVVAEVVVGVGDSHVGGGRAGGGLRAGRQEIVVLVESSVCGGGWR